MTQLESARRGDITQEMREVAADEEVDPEKLRKDIAEGRTIIVKSTRHDCAPLGIGKGLRVKINSNFGTSNFNSDISKELEKLHVSIKYGADTAMDLSTGGDIKGIRKRVIEESTIPIGSVPIYQAIVKQPDARKLDGEECIEAVRDHVEDGIDFITVHCGVTRECIPLLKKRIAGVVSRGGSFLIRWMIENEQENPLYERYDEIVEIAKKHDVVLSLGDGLRPGALADATDEAQIRELKTLGALAKRAQEKGVQVMIEGPGHVPLDQIKENVEMQKRYCGGAPFYVLGPLVTDIGMGYDHLTGAIGGALAAYHGADFLCYLTPKEHLGLPEVQDVVDGVIASKIAAHAADVARGKKGAREIDDEMSRARADLDWKRMYALSLNPERAKAMREGDCKQNADVCSMCGSFCAVKINKEVRGKY